MVRDKRTGKTKGYGFVSFANPSDLAAAVKEMNGRSFITALFKKSIIALKCFCVNDVYMIIFHCLCTLF